jgi:hypothetical protein
VQNALNCGTYMLTACASRTGTKPASIRSPGMRKFCWLLVLFLWAPSVANAADVHNTARQAHRSPQRTSTKAYTEFLRNLTRSLSDKGYTNVRLVPQLFVVTAKGAGGKPLTIIVNAKTLKAFAFENSLPDLSDEPDIRRKARH